MTKVSIKQVMLGVLSLSFIATDAFGNMLPPMPVTQTNIRVRVAASGPVPMQRPMPMPYGPQPMGQHGIQQQTNVRINIRAQGGGQCGQPGCGQRRQCSGQGHCRARIRSCGRMSRGCGGGGGGRLSVNIRIRGGGGGCFGRGRRC